MRIPSRHNEDYEDVEDDEDDEYDEDGKVCEDDEIYLVTYKSFIAIKVIL